MHVPRRGLILCFVLIAHLLATTRSPHLTLLFLAERLVQELPLTNLLLELKTLGFEHSKLLLIQVSLKIQAPHHNLIPLPQQ
jgi:hypothetical protein